MNALMGVPLDLTVAQRLSARLAASALLSSSAYLVFCAAAAASATSVVVKLRKLKSIKSPF